MPEFGFDFLGVLIVFVALIGIALLLGRGYGGGEEGFVDLGEPDVVLSKSTEIYDSFYAPFYEQLFQPGQRVEFEADVVSSRAISRIRRSGAVRVLDVAGGNGACMEVLKRISPREVDATVLDNSRDMLAVAGKRGLETIADTAMNPAAAEPEGYDVATLLFFSVQQFKDVERLVRNVRRWLRDDGVFVIHVVDRDKFDPIADPASPFPMFSSQKQAKTRVTDFDAKFNKYNQHFKMNFAGSDAKIVEDFVPTREGGGERRRNEHALQMPTHSAIHGIIERNGFELVDKVNMIKCQHEYQQMLVQKCV